MAVRNVLLGGSDFNNERVTDYDLNHTFDAAATNVVNLTKIATSGANTSYYESGAGASVVFDNGSRSITLTAPSTGGAGVRLFSRGATTSANGIYFRFRVDEATTGVAALYSYGLTSSGQYISFDYTTSSSIEFNTAVGVGSVQTTAVPALTANSIVEIYATPNVAQYVVNGSILATHTTYIPTIQLYPDFGFTPSAGTVSRTIRDVILL